MHRDLRAFAQARQCDDPLWLKVGKSTVWPAIIVDVVVGNRESICEQRKMPEAGDGQ